MVNIESYLSQLIDLLRRQYGARLLYVGLQGSYLRGEATDRSDIDIMVVIDGLCVSDLDHYRAILSSFAVPDRTCGFICSKTDLAHWNPLEICHLLHSTKDCYGALEPLVPAYTAHDVRNFVKISINGLYHEICHAYVHADHDAANERISGAYKSAFFILQDLYFLEHGAFIQTKAHLLPLLSGQDKAVLARAIRLGEGEVFRPAESFALLFAWCQDALKRL